MCGVSSRNYRMGSQNPASPRLWFLLAGYFARGKLPYCECWQMIARGSWQWLQLSNDLRGALLWLVADSMRRAPQVVAPCRLELVCIKSAINPSVLHVAHREARILSSNHSNKEIYRTCAPVNHHHRGEFFDARRHVLCRCGRHWYRWTNLQICPCDR